MGHSEKLILKTQLLHIEHGPFITGCGVPLWIDFTRYVLNCRCGNCADFCKHVLFIF